jgi:hypothetical protein
MEKFYSNIEPSLLLHVVVRESDFIQGRIDLISDENFIQCSMLQLESGKTFKPHKHIWKDRNSKIIAQESWHVISGKVKCIFYDIDDTIIAEPILNTGDTSFTLQGGHNYLILEDDTKVLEYKTGPYEGQENDKTFI